jgi:hypothetical protein
MNLWSVPRPEMPGMRRAFFFVFCPLAPAWGGRGPPDQVGLNTTSTERDLASTRASPTEPQLATSANIRLHAVAPHLGKFVVKSERCIAAHWKWRRHARV